MARAKKSEGIELLRPLQDPISIREITLMDWYAGFILMRGATPEEAFNTAEDMLKERAIRMGE